MTDLLALLRCPTCQGTLDIGDSLVVCENGHEFPVDRGVPVLLPPESLTDYKRQQAVSHDDKAPTSQEWEITRPLGGPKFHGWLMEDKYRRAVRGIEDLIPGSVALISCAGSGMDAEMLARDGASVIATDISIGCALRVAERAARNNLPIISVVADAEKLPVADKSVDIAMVHDGLHHLEDPLVGAAELCRAATQAVTITEPAAAGVTNAAMAVGATADYEEDSGNFVGRMDQARTVAALRERGFEPVAPHRYGMFYRHNPKAPSRILSRRRLYPFATRAMALANRVVGRYGNKLAVQARRSPAR